MGSYATSLVGLLGAMSLLVSSALASAEPPSYGKTSYTMSADAWAMEPSIPSMGGKAASAKFARYEGMPAGTMTLNEGLATSKTARFSTGVIDFDVKPLGYNDAGMVFHREGLAEGEFVYLRANPDCPAANDCIQYAPITHTMMGWNIYPNYQGPAPISPTGWNHVRIEVIGDGMRVYVNHAAEPSLVVPRLWGLRHDGGLAFKGPATYANLIVDPYATIGLSGVPAASVEAGTVTAWLASLPSAYDRSGTVLAKDAPAGDAWRPIEVEPTGLVNLGRAFGLARAPSPSLAWLKTEVTASSPMRRTLQVGFAEEVWVFLNGQLVYSGRNTYYPPETRLSPDGRLEPDNASIPLVLREGRNEIILAVGNDWRSGKGPFEPSHYGWAAEARFNNVAGLDLH
ncbi:MAG: hypothetical protein ACRYHQ_18060 [Janthinobacterium lividum]